MLMNLAQNFLDQVGERAIVKAEQEVYQEAACDYLTNLTEKIAEDLANEEEKMMQERLSITRRVSKMGRAKSAPRRNGIRKNKITEDEVEKKVEDKIRKMLPSLIDKITKNVEAKIMKTSCIKCERS